MKASIKLFIMSLINITDMEKIKYFTIYYVSIILPIFSLKSFLKIQLKNITLDASVENIIIISLLIYNLIKKASSIFDRLSLYVNFSSDHQHPYKKISIVIKRFS